MRNIKRKLIELQDILRDPDKNRIFKESKIRYGYNHGQPDELKVFVAEGMIRDMIKYIEARETKSRKGGRVWN